jgi:hypothetical protein
MLKKSKIFLPLKNKIKSETLLKNKKFNFSNLPMNNSDK